MIDGDFIVWFRWFVFFSFSVFVKKKILCSERKKQIPRKIYSKDTNINYFSDEGLNDKIGMSNFNRNVSVNSNKLILRNFSSDNLSAPSSLISRIFLSLRPFR